MSQLQGFQEMAAINIFVKCINLLLHWLDSLKLKNTYFLKVRSMKPLLGNSLQTRIARQRFCNTVISNLEVMPCTWSANSYDIQHRRTAGRKILYAVHSEATETVDCAL